MNEITIYQGNTKTIIVTVKDNSGTVFDLTDYTMTFMVKKTIHDTDAVVLMEVDATITTPTSGVGVVNITSTLSNIINDEYIYDITIFKSTTNKYTVIPPAKFNVLPVVNRP